MSKICSMCKRTLHFWNKKVKVVNIFGSRWFYCPECNEKRLKEREPPEYKGKYIKVMAYPR